MDLKVERTVNCLLKTLRPISILVWVELLIALVLVFWIQYSSGETTVGVRLLYTITITFWQPKTQFGLVGDWQDMLKSRKNASWEEFLEGTGELEQHRKDGVIQLQVLLFIIPVFLLIELGVSGRVAHLPSVFFSGISFILFYLLQRRYQKEICQLTGAK